jgi:crotonobetainyl-CoA:carnitine CoA-transferase CaiB-like acyl-CoA transferase
MSEITNDAAPLGGLRVLDLSTSVAGFQAGQVLADFGAEVVHVEPPGGSPLRALPSYPFLARGRGSVVLDLKDAADNAAARRLAVGADVLIETFRPGVTERLGLGYDALRAHNPGLVYGSITGFGRTGPYADVKGYEALVIARIGGLATSGGMVDRPGPAHVSAPWGSYGATQLALTGILSALHERTTSGLGQRVDTSLVAGVAAQGPYNWFLRVLTEKFPDAFTFSPPFSPNGIPNDGVFFMLLIGLTKDGRWLQFAQVQPHLFRALMGKMGLDWMYDDPKWKTVPRFETEEQRSEFWDIMLTAAQERTYAEWQAVFDADHNVWAEIFRRGAELLDHPQVQHLKAVVGLDDPVFGRVRQPGPLAAADRTPAQLGAPTPRIDEHGDALRAQGWRSERAVAPSTAPSDGSRRLALEGVTVLELGSFYAAPYGATILADLGARVVKVEPLAGEPIRYLLPFPEAGGAKVLQGKESIALDITTPEGLAIVHDIARRADLVLMSYRAGVAERQGFDEATLRKLNPDIVYVTCPGYGADGPCGDRPAYAPSIGAGSGLTMRNMGGIVPERAGLTLTEIRESARKIFGSGTNEYAQADGISAVSVATAMTLGLVIRDRTGVGQHLLTTMLTSAAHMLCDDLTLYEGRPPTIAPDDELFGFGARYRLYEAVDGWIYLAAPQEHEWPALVAALDGHVDLAGDARFADEASRVAHDDVLAAVLAGAFATRPAAEWEDHLRRFDVGCVQLDMRPPEAVLQSAEFGRASGLVTDVEHPTFGDHPRLTPLVTLSDSGGVTGAGSTVGQHTDQVLRALGYADDRIAVLRAAGVVG